MSRSCNQSRFFFAIMLSLLAGSANAAIFTYTAEGFPKGTSACADEAAQIGTRMAAQGVKVLRTACSEGPRANDLAVQYVATNRLQIETNVARGMVASGEFATLAGCEAQLDWERTLFTEQTGLNPFVSYCQVESDTFSSSWIARVEALGLGARHVFSGTMLLFGSITAGKDVADQVRRNLIERGVAIANVSMHHESLAWYVVPRYYADSKIGFDNAEITMPTREYCAAHMIDVQNAFVAAGRKELGLACSVSMTPKASLNILQIAGDGLSAVMSIENWAKLEECEAALPQLVEQYNAVYEGAVVGAVCGLKTEDSASTSRFSVYLLQK